MYRRAALGIAAIAATWGAIGIIVRQLPLPAVAIVFARCVLATATITATGLLAGRRLGWRRLPQRTTVVLLGVLLAFHWVCLFGAQQRAPVGTVLLITYLAPVVVAALAPKVLGEQVPARTFAALGVALVGTLLLVRPAPGQGTGIALALVAALTYAAITLVSKRVVGTVGGVRLALVQLASAAVALAPFAATASWGAPQASWLWLLVLGVVMTGLLGPAYLVLLDKLPASTVGVLMYLEPVSAVLLAWLVLDESPGPVTLVGGTLIVAAGIMVVRAIPPPPPVSTLEGARGTAR